MLLIINDPVTDHYNTTPPPPAAEQQPTLPTCCGCQARRADTAQSLVEPWHHSPPPSPPTSLTPHSPPLLAGWTPRSASPSPAESRPAGPVSGGTLRAGRAGARLSCQSHYTPSLHHSAQYTEKLISHHPPLLPLIVSVSQSVSQHFSMISEKSSLLPSQV